MPKLAKAGYMNEKEAAQLNEMIKERNNLAHYYKDISDKDLYWLISNLGLIDKFVEKLKKRIAKSAN